MMSLTSSERLAYSNLQDLINNHDYWGYRHWVSLTRLWLGENVSQAGHFVRPIVIAARKQSIFFQK